jgi:hypothetical protein
MLFASIPKIAVTLQFLFYAHHTTCLNFAANDSLLDFWRTSSITMVHAILEQAPPKL